MKRIITVLTLLLATQIIQAQELVSSLNGNSFVFSTGGTLSSLTIPEIASKFDTIVLNAGKSKCTHDWAIKRRNNSMIRCAVFHAGMTCPNDWMNLFRICKVCFRHENIKETQYTKEDEYEATIKKLKKP